MGRVFVTAIVVTAIAVSSISSPQAKESLTAMQIAERADLFIETFDDLLSDVIDFSKSAIARRDTNENNAITELTNVASESILFVRWTNDIANLTLAADKQAGTRVTVLIRLPFLRERLDLRIAEINSMVPYIKNQGAISRADALRKEIRELKKFISEVESSLTQ